MLQAGSQIRCLPKNRLLPRRPFADVLPNDHHSCGDANPDLQRVAGRKQDLSHLPNNLQSRPHGTFSVILVSLRVTEIDKQPVPREPADAPAEMLDRGSAGIFKSANDATQFLGIKLDRNAGRVDKIAKQHCEMSSLCLRMRRCAVAAVMLVRGADLNW